MAGRRSISVEPEDLAVASPRRSTRISISRMLHVDSPIPNAKKSDTASEIKAAPRHRRSQSIQEKSMSEIQKDVKTISARRTSRRLGSIQNEDFPSISKSETEIAPASKAVATTSRSKKAASTKEVPQKEDAQNSNENKEIVEDRPRRRVTRSMSTSPVNTTTETPKYSSLSLKKRILSMSDKLPIDIKPASLDIIKENEDEVAEASKDVKEDSPTENLGSPVIVEKKEDNPTENLGSPVIVKKQEDMLNNNRKAVDQSAEETEIKDQIESPKSEEQMKETASSSFKEKVEKMEKIIESEIQKVDENPDEPISTKKKKKEGDIEEKEKSCDSDVESSIKVLEKSINNSYLSDSGSVQDKLQITPVDEEIDKKNISNISLVQDNKQIGDVPSQNKSQDSGDSNISIVDIAENIIVSTPVQKGKTLPALTPLHNISNFELSSPKNMNSTPKTLEDSENLTPTKDDKLEQNLSLVKDDGQTYSPIKNMYLVSNSLNEDNEEENCGNLVKSVSTPKSKEILNISARSNTSKINSPKKNDDINMSKKEMLNTSIQSQSTPKLNKSKNDEPSDLKTSKIESENTSGNSSSDSSSHEKRSSKKKEYLAKIREQLLEDYIESFISQKRKREHNERSLNDSSAHIEKKSRKNVKGLDFSEEEASDKEIGHTNEFIDDEAFEGSEDTPSMDSNEIIFEGQSLGSSSDKNSDSADTYENDSFVAPNDEEFDLLSGEESFLKNSPAKKKNKRIIEPSVSSGSEEERELDPNLDKMSVEAFGGRPPSIISEQQISSIDSDLESVKIRNEKLSQQIEDGTLKHDTVEKNIDNEKVESSDDEDIIVVDTKTYLEDGSSASEAEIEKTNLEDNEEICHEINETNESIEPEEKGPTRDDLKHKEILQKFFQNLNASDMKRKRRDTIDTFASEVKIDKATQTSQKRKRRESFGLEITDIMKEEALKKFEKYRQAALNVRRNSNYEVNSSGIYRVSPSKETVKNEEELRMLQDFNDSLNENLEDVTQIKDGKVSKKQKRVHNKKKVGKREKMLDETIELGETFFANEEQELAAKLDESISLTDAVVVDSQKEEEIEDMLESKEAENEQLLDKTEPEIKASPKKKIKKRKSLNITSFEELKEEEEETIVDEPKEIEIKSSPKRRKSLNIISFEETENEELMGNKQSSVLQGETEIILSPKRRKSLNISGFEETENDELMDNKERNIQEDVLKESEIKVSIKNQKRKSMNMNGFEETEIEELMGSKEGSPKNSGFEETKIEEIMSTKEESPKNRKSLNISGFVETENEELVDNKEEMNAPRETEMKSGTTKKKNKKRKSLNASNFEETENKDQQTILDVPREFAFKTSAKKIKNKPRKSIDINFTKSSKNILETVECEVEDEVENISSSETPTKTKSEKKRKQKKQRKISESISEEEIPILVPIEEPAQKKKNLRKKQMHADNKEPPKSLKRKMKESLEEQIALVSSSNMILDVASTSSSSFDEDSKYNIGKYRYKMKKLFHYSSDSSVITSPEEKLPKLTKKQEQGFQIKHERCTVSKCENYLPAEQIQSPVKSHNYYRKIIKPSLCGNVGSEFSVTLISLPKLNHNKIKKQKNKQQSNIKVNLKNENLKEQVLKSALVKPVNLPSKR